MSSIKFGRVTRGRGKVYRLLDVSPLPERVALRVRSHTSAGNQIPAKVVAHGEQGSRLLIVPILDVAQTVTVEEVDPDGVVLDRATCTIHPRVAALRSKANTLFEHEDVLEVRNFDAQALEGEWSISIERMVRTPQGTDVVQGTARLLARTHEEPAGPVRLHIQDLRGADCCENGWTCCGDSVRPVPGHPGWSERRVGFSFRMGARVPAYIVSVVGAGAAGFAEYDARDVADYRDWWSKEATSATFYPHYMDWYKREHEVSQAELAMQSARPTDDGPLFSIVVPLYNTQVSHFHAMVKSVLRQSYEKWELVLVNASPGNTELGRAVDRYATNARVRVVTLESNRGIAANTAEGIRASHGDYVCFLDHDDVITPDALYCYAEAVRNDSSCDLLYSDEDLLDGTEYRDPFFKPGWSPDLLLGMNYVCHFLCVSRRALGQVELPGSEFDGAQDHCLTLAVSEVARSVYHVPRVLYHWRTSAQSTASGMDAKPYAVEAGRRAVQSHLDRVSPGARAVVSQRAPGRFEVVYPLDDEPLVSVIVPNKDAVSILRRCVDSIREKTTYSNYEIVIVENNSEDEETFAFYEQIQQADERVHVVRFDGPFNYSAINNFGVAESHGQHVLLLNNDTEVITPSWMRRMVELSCRKRTGAVGAKLLFPDETVQHCGILILDNPCHACHCMDAKDPGYYEVLRVMRNVSVVTGACLMVSREAYGEVGGLDEGLPVDYNDVDFCLKLRSAGYDIVVDPSVELFHHESASRGTYVEPRSKLQFARDKGEMRLRWPEYYAFGDPFYNPNFNQHNMYYAMGDA